MTCCKHRLAVVEDRYALSVAEQTQCVGLAQEVRMVSADYPTYEGQTVFTPSESAQTVQTAGRAVLTDITINPIPSNYGRITYDGSVITVS